jgi:hypothetical protein
MSARFPTFIVSCLWAAATSMICSLSRRELSSPHPGGEFHGNASACNPRLPQRDPTLCARGGSRSRRSLLKPFNQEHLPHWQLCPDGGRPIAPASLHHAHFGLPALTHAHAMIASPSQLRFVHQIARRRPEARRLLLRTSHAEPTIVEARDLLARSHLLENVIGLGHRLP